MKTYVMHGLYIALAGLLVALLLFVTGVDGDASRLVLSGVIRGVCHWGFGILFITLAVRERRAAADPARPFTYGEALWAGVATALFTALFDLVWVPLFFTVVAPNLNELLRQAQMAKFEARGLDADRLDKMEHMMRMMISTPVEAIGAAVGAVIGGTLIALVVAACFQRGAEAPRA